MNKTAIVLVFLLAVVLPLVFGACVPKKYAVDYGGQKTWFKNAKDSYRAGQTVTIYYDCIATDTDYTFYVDGTYFRPEYSDAKGFILTFRMPDHDITIRVEERNTMLPDN